MRLLLQVSIGYLAFALAACQTNKSMNGPSSSNSNQQQRNLVADKVLLSVFETGDVAKLDAVIDPAFVNHIGSDDRVGLANLKTMIQGFHARMKSVKVELKRQLSDEEYVSDWVRFTGSDPGSVIEGMEVTRYANGKAVEHWFFPNSQARRN